MTKKLECPKEINGLPVVCTWIEGWQEKMGEFIDKKQDFILLGEEEYLKQIEKAYRERAWKELIKIILLGGAGAVAVPGITAGSLSVALSLGVFAVADPEPISKIVLIVAVGAVIGITGAILIWKIIKLLKEWDEVEFDYNIGPGGYKLISIRFRASRTTLR
jgi:hypothetical protein